MKLSVQLVVWNGAKYIPYLFDSLRKQIFQDWSLIIVDNNSTDNTVAAIKKELENPALNQSTSSGFGSGFSIPYKLIENKENRGFAGGHNQSFQENDSEYILLLNQDMYLTPDCLEKMVKFLDDHPEAAAVSPRLMKWDFASICHPRESGDLVDRQDPRRSLPSTPIGGVDDNLVPGATNIIDALGLKIFRNRRVIEWATGQEWLLTNKLINHLTNKQFLEVFGVSGSFPMYRRSALQDTLLPNGDFLDSSYQSYKEDVDISLRLLSRGYKSFVLLDTVAYHDRSGAGPKELSDAAALKNKKTHSPWVKYHSYKNHLMTLYKNEYWPNLMLDFSWILWYELKKFVYFLMFDRRVLAGLGEVWKLHRELARKRQYIKELRKVDWKQIRRWWRQ